MKCEIEDDENYDADESTQEFPTLPLTYYGFLNIENGSRIKFGKTIFENGDLHLGHYVNDKKHGLGI